MTKTLLESYDKQLAEAAGADLYEISLQEDRK